MLHDKEHYDLMAAFERCHSGRFDKEDKALWPKGVIYQDGRINELFLAFRQGYAYTKHTVYGDGFYAGEEKGFRDGYSEALADVRLKLEGAIDTAISALLGNNREARSPEQYDALPRRGAAESEQRTPAAPSSGLLLK